MTLATLVLAALFAGVLAYAVFGGADFGVGFYDLTAGKGIRGDELRTLIDHSIGPVWEANHVWLVYVLVIWWTGFPETFAAVTTTLFIPLALALLGIVLRGTAFAFRKYSATYAQARFFGVVFAASSLLTPLFLGAVAGSIASGRVPASGYGGPWSSWLSATSLFGGAIAVGTCTFLAGVFLAADADRAGKAELAEVLRRRTLSVGVLTGLVVFAALVPIHFDAPTLAAELQTRGAPLIVGSGAAGVASLLLVLRRRYARSRVAAVTAVAAVLLGWGDAQYPWVLVDQVKVEEAAGASATLVGLLVVVGLAAVIVLPALIYLLRLTQTERWTHD